MRSYKAMFRIQTVFRSVTKTRLSILWAQQTKSVQRPQFTTKMLASFVTFLAPIRDTYANSELVSIRKNVARKPRLSF